MIASMTKMLTMLMFKKNTAGNWGFKSRMNNKRNILKLSTKNQKPKEVYSHSYFHFVEV